MNPRNRKSKFIIDIRNYYREDCDDDYIKTYYLNLMFVQIPPEKKSETSYDVITWLSKNKDLPEIFKNFKCFRFSSF